MYSGFNGQTKGRDRLPPRAVRPREGAGGGRGQLPWSQVSLEQEEGAVQGVEPGGQEEQCRAVFARGQKHHQGLQVKWVFHGRKEMF